MNVVERALFAAMDSKAKKVQEYNSHRERIDAEFEAKKRARAEFLSSAGIRPATAADYAKWLVGFLTKGGKITHTYDYPLEQRGTVINGNTETGLTYAQADPDWYYVGSGSHTLPSLHGAASINLIVNSSANVRITGSHSHNTAYFMSGYRAYESYFVPVYTDVMRVITENM